MGIESYRNRTYPETSVSLFRGGSLETRVSAIFEIQFRLQAIQLRSFFKWHPVECRRYNSSLVLQKPYTLSGLKTFQLLIWYHLKNNSLEIVLATTYCDFILFLLLLWFHFALVIIVISFCYWIMKSIFYRRLEN